MHVCREDCKKIGRIENLHPVFGNSVGEQKNSDWSFSQTNPAYTKLNWHVGTKNVENIPTLNTVAGNLTSYLFHVDRHKPTILANIHKLQINWLVNRLDSVLLSHSNHVHGGNGFKVTVHSSQLSFFLFYVLHAHEHVFPFKCSFRVFLLCSVSSSSVTSNFHGKWQHIWHTPTY